jgi:TM2 domain-containing membrane protein YozV
MSDPSAGWYPDPGGSGGQRYWDGARWTDTLAPAMPPESDPATGYGAAPLQPYRGGVPAYQVAPKSVALCVLLSVVIPGLGSLVAGNTRNGLIILIGMVISAILVVVVIGLLGMIGFYIWGLVDAYQSAQRWNLEHGIIS